MQASDAVSEYLDDVRAAGRRANTLRGYETDLRVLVNCAAQRGGELDAEAVADYLAWPTARAASTQARRMSVLRGLLRSCGRADLLPVESPAPPSTPARPAPPRDLRADIDAILATIPLHADRDQLLFGMLASVGLRPGEALALQIEDFDEASASLRISGWGGHERRVLVDDNQTLLRLTNRIRFSERTSGPLFTGRGRDTPLRYQSAQHRWEQYCSAAGVTLHLSDLRRAHAAELLAGGVPEAVVRERLGQRTGALTTTAVNAAASDAELRAWHERREALAKSVADVTQSRAG